MMEWIIYKIMDWNAIEHDLYCIMCLGVYKKRSQKGKRVVLLLYHSPFIPLSPLPRDKIVISISFY